MKAYKATDYKMRCRGFQFELGIKYTHDDKLEPCFRGFHACRRVFDLDDYYNFANSRIFEVEIEDFIEHPDKLCARHITFIRELTFHEVMSMANLDKEGREFKLGYNKNLGFFNTGNYNRGDYNSGNYNRGNYNMGNSNIGDCNKGDCNKGDFNSGNFNRGNNNIGNNNIGNNNIGNNNNK